MVPPACKVRLWRAPPRSAERSVPVTNRLPPATTLRTASVPPVAAAASKVASPLTVTSAASDAEVMVIVPAGTAGTACAGTAGRGGRAALDVQLRLGELRPGRVRAHHGGASRRAAAGSSCAGRGAASANAADRGAARARGGAARARG